MGSTVARKSEKLAAKASLRDTGTVKFDSATDTTVLVLTLWKFHLITGPVSPPETEKG